MKAKYAEIYVQELGFIAVKESIEDIADKVEKYNFIALTQTNPKDLKGETPITISRDKIILIKPLELHL